jgi:hypothetical protein
MPVWVGWVGGAQGVNACMVKDSLAAVPLPKVHSVQAEAPISPFTSVGGLCM